MPSAAEETTYLNLIDVMPRRETTTQDFLTRDVDLLVSQIKENLRLSGFKAKSSFTQKSRPSPYRIPSRSWADPAATCEVCGIRNDANGVVVVEDDRQQHHNNHHNFHHHHHHHHHLNHHQKRTNTNVDDPYELLQVLLREGGLIKEAVKRLQANLEELENAEESEYERKPYFYDSEDEPRPVIPPLEMGPMEPHFVRGEHTLRVPMSLFRENRERLVSRLRSNTGVPNNGAYVILQGGVEIPFNDTDICWPFRQESYFQWCFGVEEPDCYGAIDVTSGQSILFFPRLPAEYAVWQGHLYTTDDFRKRYAVDKVYYTDEIADVLTERGASMILTLHGTNSDSGLVAREAIFDKIGQFKVNNDLLYPEISECTNAEGVVAPRRPQLLSRSTILVQDGSVVHEVPLIVRKITDPLILCNKSITASREAKISTKIEKKVTKIKEGRESKKKRRIDIETDEGTAVLFGSDLEFLKEADVDQLLEGLESCYTPKGIFSLLETMIVSEINSIVALQALRKIIDIENGPGSKNRMSVTARNRDVVMAQIVEMIAVTQESESILEALGLLARDSISPMVNSFRNRLSDEIASRVADDELNIVEIVQAVTMISKFKSLEYQEAVDSLWIGLSSKEKDITIENLVPLFRILPLFKKSQRLVQTILERSMARLFDKLTGRHVADILNILANSEIESLEAVRWANKWAAFRAKNVAQEDLTDLVKTWTVTRHVDPAVEKILELHVGPGKNGGRKSKEDPALIGAIMNYCGTMRIRNSRILTGCADYLSKNGRRLSPSTIAPIFGAFGVLNFRPPEPVASRFWRTLEDTVAAKFVQLKPDEALDILLAFVYLEKYPMRFIGKVFRTNFLDRLTHRRNIRSLESSKIKLKLFDAAMTLECPKYNGPMLPRDEQTGEPILQDIRLKKIVNRVYQHLAKIAGGDDKISKSLLLGQLPRNELYVVDAMIHKSPMKSSSSQTFNFEKIHHRLSTAILIHLPEHFCRNSQHLIGPQVMRIRHLRKLGLPVMTLDYETLVKLSANPVAIVQYLKERIAAVEKAL